MPLLTNNDLKTAFGDVQSNILKSHGRDFGFYLFLRFSEDHLEEARQWIAQTLAPRLYSASRQVTETQDFKDGKLENGSLVVNFFLSADGYRKLGEDLGLKVPDDERFLQGMKASQERLNDPAPEEWEPGYRGTIDAMILLADSPAGQQPKGIKDPEGREHRNAVPRPVPVAEVPQRLLDALGQLRDELRPFATILAEEAGAARFVAFRGDDVQTGIEHFGYADGLSQPIFIEEHYQELRNKKHTGDAWDDRAEKELVLVRDPNGAGEMSFGSYFVFRKLEQNVKGFKEAEDKLGEELVRQGGNFRERAGALLVGRFEDGTPVVLSEQDGHNPAVTNDFNYRKVSDTDPDTHLKCPFHAHIRKTNPRGDSELLNATLEEERAHRLTRRGIPYGARQTDLEDRPEGGVGLLFMCYQRDLAQGFEFVQGAWANNGGFVNHNTGLDPIIGQGNRTEFPQEICVKWGDDSVKIKSDFGAFVTMKGGEYFFAPSISSLQAFHTTA